jgi:hypothetical protein
MKKAYGYTPNVSHRGTEFCEIRLIEEYNTDVWNRVKEGTNRHIPTNVSLFILTLKSKAMERGVCYQYLQFKVTLRNIAVLLLQHLESTLCSM